MKWPLIIRGIFGGLLVSAASGCVQLDQGHCMVNGGDLACSDGRVCVASIEVEHGAPGEQPNGCADPDPDPERFVRVAYGLPSQLGAPGDEGFDSVAGVLTTAAPDCTIGGDDLEGLAPAWEPLAEVRRHLLQRPRAKASAFDLDAGHVEAIVGFGRALDEWVDACVPLATDTTDTESDTEGTTTTEGDSSSTGGDCIDDDSCQGAAGGPFCDPLSGQCVECGGNDPDGACAGNDPSAPVCAEGVCVECSAGNTSYCDADARVCDVETSTCMGCTAHEQCQSGACERALSRCFDAELSVIHVDGDGGRDFVEVQLAIDSIPARGRALVVVHEQDADLAYPEAVVIDAGKTIVLIGAPGEQPRLNAAKDSPSVSVLGSGTTAYLDRLWLLDNIDGGLGLLVNGAVAWVDRSVIVRNDVGGIRAWADAELVLHNCFVGADPDDIDSVNILDSSVQVVDSTIGAATGMAAALRCDASSTLLVRNSIVVARAIQDEVQCSVAVFEYSASERDRGATNLDLDSLDSTWFVDYASGDFHLSGQAPEALQTVGRWEAGDPFTDIDGDPRPRIEGEMDYAGADVRNR